MITTYSPEQHLEKARELLQSCEPQYACLELRLTIEAVVYSIITNKQNSLPYEVYANWQPKRVIDALVRFDPGFKGKREFAFSTDGTANECAPKESFRTFAIVENTEALYKKINRIYHGLSSKLHQPLPEKGNMSADRCKETVKKALPEVESLVHSARSIVAFNHTWECPECSTPFVFSNAMVESGEVFRCHNGECMTSFRAKQNDVGEIQLNVQNKRLKCGNCDAPMPVPLSLHLDGGEIECKTCERKHYYKANFEYALLPNYPNNT